MSHNTREMATELPGGSKFGRGIIWTGKFWCSENLAQFLDTMAKFCTKFPKERRAHIKHKNQHAHYFSQGKFVLGNEPGTSGSTMQYFIWNGQVRHKLYQISPWYLRAEAVG